MDRGAEEAQPVGARARARLRRRSEARLGGVLGVGHETHDVAALIAHPGDIAGRAVGVGAQVAEDDESLPLQPVELLGRGDEVALGALHRDGDLLALGELVGPGGAGAVHPQALLDAHEALVVVADERTGQQVGLSQDLEAVADPQHGHACLGGVDDLPHDGGEAGDGPAAQVVAIGESSGDDQGIHALEVGVLVPQGHGLGARQAHGPGGVDVVEGAGEGDDADAGGCSGGG